MSASNLTEATDTASKPYMLMLDYFFVLFVWAAIVIIRYVMSVENVEFATGSTDDTMRLHQVRDLIEGKGWFGGLFDSRLGGPAGLMSHWSRLVDIPIAVLILIAKPIVGAFGAESFALIVWPSLLYLAFIAGFLAIGKKFDTGAGFPAVLAGALGCINLAFLFKATALDHHNLQVVLSLWLFVCAMWLVEKPHAAIAGGVVAAMMVTVGLENIHIYAVLNIYVVYLALADIKNFRKPVQRFLITQAVCLVLFWLATVPPQVLLKPMCDAIAVNSVFACVGACGVAYLVIQNAERWSLLRSAGTALLGLIAIAGLALAIEPACIGGPNAMVNPRAITVWMDSVGEANSLLNVLKTKPSDALVLLAYPILSLVIAGALLLARKMTPALWAMIVCVVLATAVMILQIRGSTYSNLFGAIFVTIGMIKLIDRAGTIFNIARLLATGFVPPVLVLSVLMLFPANPAPVTENVAATTTDEKAKLSEVEYCTPRWGYPSLGLESNGTLLNHIDMGPALLLHTKYNVMLAPYHRTSDAIVAGYDLIASPVASALEKLKSAGITHLADCTAQRGFLPERGQRDDNSPILQDVMRGTVQVPWAEALPPDPRRPEIKIWRLKF